MQHCKKNVGNHRPKQISFPMDQLIIGRTFQQIPFVPLSYIILSVVVTTAVISNKQLPSYLYFDPARTMVNREYWRIISNYLILPSAPDGIIFSNSIQFVIITHFCYGICFLLH